LTLYKNHSISFYWVFCLIILINEGLFATDSTITGTTNGPNGSDDNWNNAANWNNGVPTGAMNAIISTGVLAQEDDITVPAYGGNLYLQSAARLRAKDSSGNIFGNGNLFLEEGSDLEIGYNGTISIGNINLLGNAIISGGWSTVGHNDTRNFDQPISGNYSLTFEGVNNNSFNLNSPNTFGELITDRSTGTNFRVFGKVAGSMGIGNVTINDTSSLYIDADNAISDSADLYLVDAPSTKPNSSVPKLQMNADDTVNKLYIDGIQQISGAYTSSESWISGTGTLTVLTDPPPVPPILLSIGDDIDGGPLWMDYGANIIYTYTFDLDMDDTTVTSIDFENAGNAIITIGTITEISSGVMTVEVYPTSPGNLVLQIKQGQLLQTSVGANLDTSSALPDDTEIIIGSGNSPDTTITGTSNGPGGSDDTWNLKANWDNGRPLGPQNAIIGANTNTYVDTQILNYSGNIFFKEGSFLKTSSDTGKTAVQISPSSLIFYEGSTFRSRGGGFGSGSITLGPIILLGSATISLGESDNSTVTFSDIITGDGSLYLSGRNTNKFILQTANSYNGGTIINTSNNSNYAKATSNSAFGKGSVTIANLGSLWIDSGLTDTIYDFAILNLNGSKSSQLAAKVVLDSDETILALFVDGIQQPFGTHGSTSSSAQFQNDTHFNGTGILNVVGPTGTIIHIE
jgi:hypothetical protein